MSHHSAPERPATALAPSADPRRVRALDWLRGVVMILMAVDHASAIYNGERIANDNALLHTVGAPLPEAQFFTRWITHLCAPAFVLLAGMAIALAGSRRADGAEARAFDQIGRAHV